MITLKKTQKIISSILIFILLSISLPIEGIAQSMVLPRSTTDTIIDLTDITTGGNASHTCIFEKKYSETNHWEECFICHTIKNKETHNLEVTGAYGCAAGYGYQKQSCKDGCGYSKTLPKQAHTPGEWRTDYNRGDHIKSCTVCGNQTNRVSCRNAQGELLGCASGITGTCAVCGAVYNSIEHNLQIDSGNCTGCGEKFVNYTSSSQIVGPYSTRVTWKITPTKSNMVVNLDSIYLGSWSGPTPAPQTEVNSVTKNSITGEITVVGEFTYSTQNAPQDEDSRCYGEFTLNGRTYKFNVPGPRVNTDNVAPVKKSITVQGNGTAQNYSMKSIVIAQFTEDFDTFVQMAIFDDKGNQISNWEAASRSGNTFTKAFDVILETTGSSNLIVKARDSCGNTAQERVTVNYLDSKPPTLLSTRVYNTPWSKERVIKFEAEDIGVGGVQIGFNSESDYQVATYQNGKYTRTYKFVGDVYEDIVGALYLKDSLGNSRTEKITIGKIDNTPPTITNVTQTVSENKKSIAVTIQANDINTQLQKSGSGVVGYQITTTNTAPTTYQASNQFNINKNGTYYVWVKDGAGNVVQASTTIVLKNIENTLKINPNGGNWQGSTQEQNFKLTYESTKNIVNPTRNGFTFIGWTKSEETSQINGNTFTMGTGDVTLTANWRRNSYVLTVKPAGGTWNGSTQNQEFNLDYEATKNIANPTRTAYRFTGWSVEGIQSSIEATTFRMGYENATLTANWQLITHNINGSVIWEDFNNQYISRPNKVTITLNRAPITGAITNLPPAKEVVGNANYTFNDVQTYTADTGENYNYTVTQNQVDGYETIIDGYNITNHLILPDYTSSLAYEPIDTYQNNYLKNGTIKVTGMVRAKEENREQVGLHQGQVTLEIDSGIKINQDTIEISYYQASTGQIIKLTNYQIKDNTITVVNGIDTNGVSQKGDYLKIELQGITNKIGNYESTISATGKLKDYRGTHTQIDLREVTTTTQAVTVENQLPEANLQIIKKDSITKENLTDAEFTIYEWNGESYQEVEIITDDDQDGVYTSKVYRWNKATQGKYKIVETKTPKYHTDLNFKMEYTIDELKQQNYVITPDYDNEKYKIEYETRNPDQFSRTNKIVENEPWKIKIQIENIDSETKNTIQKEAKFTLYEWNKQTSQYEESKIKIERQESKQYLSNQWLYYTSQNEGKYRIIQTQAPQGYYGDYDLNKQKRTYDINIVEKIENKEINNADTVIIKNAEKFENKRVKGTVYLQIIDNQTKKEPQAQAKLEGAVYGIYAFHPIYHADGITSRHDEQGLLYKKDEFITTQTTNQDAEAIWEDLETGIYYIQMLEAPEGYKLDETKYRVDLSYQNEEILQEQGGGQIEIAVKKQAFQLKKIQEDETPIENAGFSIYLIEQLKIVKEGKVERKTANQYILKDEEAKKDEKLTKKANEDGTYEITDLIDYYYKIQKDEDDKEELPGDENSYQPYDLSKEEKVKNYDKNVQGEEIGELKTDENGYIRSPKLAYGEYIVIETNVPRKQDVAKPFVVEIQEDKEEPQEIRIIIDPNFRSKIKIYVKDAINKEIIQNNVSKYIIRNAKTNELQTYKVKEQKNEVEYGTKENPFVVGKEGCLVIPMQLEIGEYIIEQIEAPKGYAKNWKEENKKEQENIRISIKSNTAYYVDKETGEYVTVITQTNEPTKLQIKTIDKETKKALTGIKIEIQDEKGKTVAVSSEEAENRGEYLIQKLPVGKYKIIQTKIPYEKGYVVKQEKHLELKDTKEWQELDIEQEMSKVKIEVEDKETKEKLENLVIQVYKKENDKDILVARTQEQQEEKKEKVKTIEKTKEGYHIKGLPVGEYEIEEVVQDGYQPIPRQKLLVKDTKEEQVTKIENRKLIFSMELSKKVEEVRVNGQKLNINNQLAKIDLKGKEINKQDIQIQYVIEVKNTGEIEGTIGVIKDIMPTGFQYIEQEKGIWEVNGIVAVCNKYKEEKLKPGQNKQIRITLKWKNGVGNMGEKVNHAYLEGSTNQYDYKNSAQSTNQNTQMGESQIPIIIGIQTGEDNIRKIIIFSIVLLVISTIIIIMLKSKTHE